MNRRYHAGLMFFGAGGHTDVDRRACRGGRFDLHHADGAGRALLRLIESIPDRLRGQKRLAQIALSAAFL
jgi:hypothetical protein